MYMVQFTSGEGRPSHHVSDSLDEAIRFVERLRNTEGVDDARLYEMTEVPLEVKAYYQVQIKPVSQSFSTNGVSSLEVSEDVTTGAVTGDSDL